jgi:hypothetical protein
LFTATQACLSQRMGVHRKTALFMAMQPYPWQSRVVHGGARLLATAQRYATAKQPCSRRRKRILDKPRVLHGGAGLLVAAQGYPGQNNLVRRKSSLLCNRQG